MLGKFTVLVCILLAACSPEPQINKIQGQTQGTTYHVSYWSAPQVAQQTVQAEVEKILDAIDRTLSNYRPDSAIESFNAATTTESQDVGAEIVSLVAIAEKAYRMSGGCFDLTVKPLFDLWGFKGDTLTIPSEDALRQGLSRVGMDKLKIVDGTHLSKNQADVQVDLSAVAQGYSVGKVGEVLEKLGIRNYLVEIGGELKTNGHKPDGQAWRIAIEKPLAGENGIHKIVTMPKDVPMSVMTSGTYRHYFDANGQRYSHILDGRTGRPVTHESVAVTVFHENPAIADAWSTALLCLGEREGLQVADGEKLSVVFISQRNGELLETQSAALKVASGLSIE